MVNKNPFSPGKIMIDSEKYAGRNDLIIESFSYIKNQRSIFVTGQRGVGKSSFAMQLSNLLNKEVKTFERFNINRKDRSINTIVVNYRCTGVETVKDLIINLLFDLSKKIDRSLKKIPKITKKWKFDLKVFSHENQRDEYIPTPSITKEFSELIISCFESNPKLYSYDICFMIDEVDLIINKIELGIFIKVFLENLSDVGFQNIKFILVGISKGLNLLKQQHPSITRYLVPIYVPPMTEGELYEIINRALAETEIKFDEEICQQIYMLSQGFPDPVHLIGYEIYNYLINHNYNDNSQIFESVLKKITTIIKKEEFLSIKNKIPNYDCERLLLEMAKINQEFVHINILSRRINVSEEECNKQCKLLTKNNFLEQNGLGSFRFMDPLFRIYINMVNIESEVSIERIKAFMKLNTIINQSYQSSTDKEIIKREKLLYNVILRNYNKTGKSGFWDL